MHHTIWINAWENKTKKEHTKTHFSCPLQLLLIPCGKFNAYNTFVLLLDCCNPCLSLANYKLKRLNGKLSFMLFSTVHDYSYKSRHLAIDYKRFLWRMLLIVARLSGTKLTIFLRKSAFLYKMIVLHVIALHPQSLKPETMKVMH